MSGFQRPEYTRGNNPNSRRTTHGYRHTPEYKIWIGIKQRCNNPNDKAYPAYGGRGITVCSRWMSSFSNFLDDMGRRTDVKFTLERIKNDGPYSPDNCKWATQAEQNNNQRKSVRLEYGGRTQTMADWAREWHINYATFKWYISFGRSMEFIYSKRGI